MSTTWDAAIAGAGPGGAALAVRLARAGLRVVLVDRAVFPRPKPCSEYMSPECLRHLAALGVLDAVEHSAGHPIRGTMVQAPRGARLTGLFARAGYSPFRDTGLSADRPSLDLALLDAARRAGATILEGSVVRGVIRQDGRVAGLRVKAGGRIRELPARLTAGADGIRSVVARALGPLRSGPLRRYGVVAHAAGVRGLTDVAELHVRRDGYVGLNPLRGGIASIGLVLPAPAMRGARGRLAEFLFDALARFPGVAGRIPRAGLTGPVQVTGPFAQRASRVTAPGGGALLLGDAADFFDPFTGEGICAALRGAELAAGALLAPLLRDRPLPAAAFRRYRRARRRAFAGKWVVERLIGYGMLAPALFDRTVARLERRGLAHTVIGVTGDFVPARAMLHPLFLSRVVF